MCDVMRPCRRCSSWARMCPLLIASDLARLCPAVTNPDTTEAEKPVAKKQRTYGSSANSPDEVSARQLGYRPGLARARAHAACTIPRDVPFTSAARLNSRLSQRRRHRTPSSRRSARRPLPRLARRLEDRKLLVTSTCWSARLAMRSCPIRARWLMRCVPSSGAARRARRPTASSYRPIRCVGR